MKVQIPVATALEVLQIFWVKSKQKKYELCYLSSRESASLPHKHNNYLASETEK